MGLMMTEDYIVPNLPSVINEHQLLEEVRTIFPDSLLNKRSDGTMRVTTVDVLDTTEQATLATIIENHQAVDWDAVEQNAIHQAKNIPGWATWDETQAQTWHDDNIRNPIDQLKIDVVNITNLATALPVLVTIVDVLDKLGVEGWSEARMLIALRNKVFPNLEGSNGS